MSSNVSRSIMNYFCHGGMFSRTRPFQKLRTVTSAWSTALPRLSTITSGLLLMFAITTAFGAKTWYVDPAATGLNNGTSWGNAWNSIYFTHRDSNNVAAGDTVFIAGGVYPGTATWKPQEGISGIWTHYYFTNGVATLYCAISLRGYTELNGGRTPNYETNLVGTYDVQKIPNNINLYINRSTNWYGNGSGGRSISVFGVPTTLKWIHITGTTNKYATDPPEYTKSDSASEIFYDVGTTSTINEAGYIWIDQSSGHGAGAAITVASTGTGFGCFNIHHSLFENNGSDLCNFSGGVDYHHNIIRNRYGATYQGCNDTFTIGGSTIYIRIYDNLIEPADNTLFYLWGAVANIHDFYFYNNLITPARPQYGNQYHFVGKGIMEQDMLAGPMYYLRTNVVFANNTYVGTTNNGPLGFFGFVSKNDLANDITIDPGAMVIKNNLFLHVDTVRIPWPDQPLGLSAGLNNLGKGWHFSPSSIVLNYNMFWAYYPGNMRCGSWGDSWSTPIVLMNAADIARVMGYANNISTVPVAFVDAPNYDYRPATSAVNIGQDLGNWTSLMPDLDKDIFGTPRGQGGSWSVGAIEYQSITPTAPSISLDPISQAKAVGDSVTFAVSVTGTSPLSYQWLYNATPIGGATAASYTLTSVTTNNSGRYSVIVNNAYGTVTSQPATLTVTVATGSSPFITSQPASQSVAVGTPAAFTVAATGSNPLAYQWRKNGTDIPGATSSTFTIITTTANDAGSFTVVVANSYGSVTSQAATLAVNSSPLVTTQPASQSVSVGASATFSVAATGSAPLAYQWYQNGTAIPGATSSSYSIVSATTNDAGNYTVVIANSYGSVTSPAATLTVGSGPLNGSLTDGLVLWLTFDQSDGWTTNGVITDKSGRGNHAYYMPSTNRNTWPSYTSGPNGLSAAQFIVNYTNGLRYGTYAAITSLSTNTEKCGLAWFTNATWACWAYIDNEHVLGDSGFDAFLTCGQDRNNWHFGKYYSDSPMFWRTMDGGENPLESYVNWPNVTVATGWKHYAITWDGTNFTPYLNGVFYKDTPLWINENSGYVTNKYTGVLVSTNLVDPAWNWIGVGVNTHSNLPYPDGYYAPNNGQLWGRLADIRIYNRPLSAAEISTIYNRGGGQAIRPSAPNWKNSPVIF